MVAGAVACVAIDVTGQVQVMIAVFDFPAWSDGDDDHVPELIVDWVEHDSE